MTMHVNGVTDENIFFTLPYGGFKHSFLEKCKALVMFRVMVRVIMVNVAHKIFITSFYLCKFLLSN